MTRNQRIGLLVGVIVVAVVALIVAHPGSNSSKHKGTVAATVHVHGGKAVGGVQVVKAGKNQTLKLTVVSDDYKGEVHFHGYDVKRDVAPGKPATFDFKLTDDGGFVVELEATGTQIASVQVAP
jgi:hypothetical protein